jgi:hypothetical protein
MRESTILLAIWLPSRRFGSLDIVPQDVREERSRLRQMRERHCHLVLRGDLRLCRLRVLVSQA